jgi:hypothetical protein
MTNRKFCSFTRVLPGCFLACAFTLLSGCGLQGTASYVEPSVSVAGAAISGRALGGVIPIIGARVTLWETSSNGYPGSSSTCYDAISSDTVYSTLCSSSTRAAATSIALATTKTTGAGSFAFTAGSYTCDSSQFVYITATGGNTGAGANTQSVQIAPLGSCSNFQTTAQEGKVFIDVGEATTVVTAYTLGNFTYVTDNGTGTQVVYISAPASNNTATGSCTSPGTTGPPPNTNTAPRRGWRTLLPMRPILWMPCTTTAQDPLERSLRHLDRTVPELFRRRCSTPLRMPWNPAPTRPAHRPL